MRKRSVADWLERLARSEHTLWLLFAASFAETIIVPIPIELVLIPYMSMNRKLIWRAATAVLAGCLAAALTGYMLGYLFFETAGEWAIRTFGWSSGYAEFSAMFEQYGFFAILAVGVIPIPFQIGMLTAGAAGYPIVLFLLAAIIARGIRYYGLALIVWKYGDHLHEVWRERRRTVLIVAGIATALAITAYLATTVLK